MSEYLVAVLEEAGYSVVASKNADEAIAILESRDDVDIVFTDINMPGSMDGLSLAAAVRDRWPTIKLIVTSGKGRLESREMPVGSSVHLQAGGARSDSLSGVPACVTSPRVKDAIGLVSGGRLVVTFSTLFSSASRAMPHRADG